MTNLKKIGLAALAGTLAATTFAQAGELTVGGTARMEYQSNAVDTSGVDTSADTFSNNGTITFLCCKYASIFMKKRKYGKILNISSIAGRFRGLTSGTHYAYAKSGVIGLTRQLAYELSNFKINAHFYGK